MSEEKEIKQVPEPPARPESPPIVLMEKLPVVTVIVTANTGGVINHFVIGVSLGLAHWLADASKFDDPEKPVVRTKSMLTVLAQEAYEVRRDIVSMLLIMGYPRRSLPDIFDFQKSMPEIALYTLVVNY